MDTLIALIPPLLIGVVPLAFGLGGIRSWRIPLAGVALLFFAYLAFVVSMGIWAEKCLQCNAGELDRAGSTVITAVVLIIWLLAALCVLGVGALLAWFVRGSSRVRQ